MNVPLPSLRKPRPAYDRAVTGALVGLPREAAGSANKRSWAQAQGGTLRLSPASIWPQARALAWSLTWPTARHFRRAAESVTAAPHGARQRPNAMSEPASGVAFLCILKRALRSF